MSSAGLFSTELKVFEANRSEWFRWHPGAYVVIQGETVVEGFFGSYAEALKAGLRKFGAGRSFLVKQIWMTEPVYFVS